MGIDKATIHRIGRQTIRGENTPQGDNTLIVPRRNVHAPTQEWAYNTTGYELKAGYIVEVTDYDPTTNKYTIRRPSADGLPNIAVVKSSQTLASDGNRVELQFSGTALLWYSSTAPTVADTVGSKKDSFEVLIGASGFAPLETGATVGGSGRCRARFFNAGGGEVHYAKFADGHYNTYFDGNKFYDNIETQYIEFKRPVFLTNSMAWLVYGDGITYGRVAISGKGTNYSGIDNFRLVMYNAAEEEIGEFTQPIDSPGSATTYLSIAQYSYENRCSSSYVFQAPLRGDFTPALGITDFVATKAKIKFFLNANSSYELQIRAEWFVFFNFNNY